MAEVQIYAAHLTPGDWQSFGSMEYHKVTRLIRGMTHCVICYLDHDPVEVAPFDDVTILRSHRRATAYRRAWHEWLRKDLASQLNNA